MESKVWYRGTTPTVTFTLPFASSQVAAGHIVVMQANYEIVRNLADCDIEENTISTKLTQEETLRFMTKIPVKIQFRCKLQDNSTLATAVVERIVKDILKDGKI